MTWTRMERAAVDYALASRVGADPSLPPDALHAVLSAHHALDRGPPDRVVDARLALYLRLLRRVEAWERGAYATDGTFWAWPSWEVRYEPGDSDGWIELRRVPADEWLRQPRGPSVVRLKAWHPLWIDAPPYDPAVTPRMRREAIEARRERMRSGINKAAKATFGPMAKAFPRWKP